MEDNRSLILDVYLSKNGDGRDTLHIYGDDIPHTTVKIIKAGANKAKLKVTAPLNVCVDRDVLYRRKQKEGTNVNGLPKSSC